MTQSIIPGCEANPDPATVINVGSTMKEIPMDELKRDCDTDKKMQDTFDTLLVSSANAAENGKELLEENKRLNEECEQLVRRNHELYDEVTRLRNQPALAELNEFKKELEDRFEDSSIGKLRQVCGEYDAWAGALSDIGESITDADFIEEFPEKWNKLNNSCGATLRSVLETVDCKVSVCMDDWFVYSPSGPALIKKWVCSVNEPLLNRGVKHIGFEATPTLLNGTLTLENMRINIFI